VYLHAGKSYNNATSQHEVSWLVWPILEIKNRYIGSWRNMILKKGVSVQHGSRLYSYPRRKTCNEVKRALYLKQLETNPHLLTEHDSSESSQSTAHLADPLSSFK
jgi:hypothetical protein